MARSTINRPYLITFIAVAVPYTTSICITSAKLVGNGNGWVLRLDLGMVATSPRSITFSRSLVEMEKLETDVCWIWGNMASMLRKPNAFRSWSVVKEVCEGSEDIDLYSVGRRGCFIAVLLSKRFGGSVEGLSERMRCSWPRRIKLLLYACKRLEAVTGMVVAFNESDQQI